MLPLDDPCVERVIFRDVDSLINVREAAAVDAWVSGGEAFHILHDAATHTLWPIQGRTRDLSCNVGN